MALALWKMMGQEGWERTEKPWALLRNLFSERLRELADDAQFCYELKPLIQERVAYQTEVCWYGEVQVNLNIGHVAYFSMVFGLGEALPIYAGGLGVLAGDYFKTASDLYSTKVA